MEEKRKDGAKMGKLALIKLAVYAVVQAALAVVTYYTTRKKPEVPPAPPEVTPSDKDSIS